MKKLPFEFRKYWENQGYKIIVNEFGWLATTDKMAFYICAGETYYVNKPTENNKPYSKEEALRLIKLKALW